MPESLINVIDALDSVVNAPEGVVDALASYFDVLENGKPIRSVVAPKLSWSLQRCCKSENIKTSATRCGNLILTNDAKPMRVLLQRFCKNDNIDPHAR